MFQQPSFLNVKLYPHQLESIRNITTLEREKKIIDDKNRTELETRVGFFRDKPGHGKTLSMCVVIMNQIQAEESSPTWWMKDPLFIREEYTHLSHGARLTRRTSFQKCDCSIVICAPNIVHQWKDELLKCQLKVCVINSNKRVAEIDIDTLNSNFHVIVTSINFFGPFLAKFKDFAFRRCIYDEIADLRVKDVKEMELIADFYWFISATIYSKVHSKNRFLTNLLPEHFHHYDLISIKNDDEFIERSITLPTPSFVTHYYAPNAVTSLIGSLLNEKLKHLVVSGNIAEAMSSLNARSEENLFDAIIRDIDETINKLSDLPLTDGTIKKITDAKHQKESILARLKDNPPSSFYRY